MATVDNGAVTARKEGSAQIRVETEDGGRTAEVTVTVIAASDPEKEKAEQSLKDALNEASKIDRVTGADKYTDDSWKKFIDAFQKVSGLTEEQIS